MCMRCDTRVHFPVFPSLSENTSAYCLSNSESAALCDDEIGELSSDTGGADWAGEERAVVVTAATSCDSVSTSVSPIEKNSPK